MTQRHFKALAAAIHDLPETASKADVVNTIGRVCQSFNSNFKWHLFEEACVPERQRNAREALGLPITEPEGV